MSEISNREIVDLLLARALREQQIRVKQRSKTVFTISANFGGVWKTLASLDTTKINYKPRPNNVVGFPRGSNE